MPQHRVNSYTCPACGRETVTRDIHEGTTPFLMACPKCGDGLAQSSFYRCNQFQDAEVLWVRPTTGELVKSEHVKLGGLIPVAASRSLRPIFPQRQPNPAACMVTAFAMVIGVPVAELIEQLGHDGTAVRFPEQEGAKRHLGFHIQELIWAMMEREYAVVPFEPLPVARSGDVTHQYGPNPFFEHAMMSFSGVLCGRTSRATEHAIAWSAINKKSTDPRTATTMDDINLVIRTFYAVIPKSNHPLDSKNLS
jgi:DNA-directed RNA polymerase subunit RPC12/RpoP